MITLNQLMNLDQVNQLIKEKRTLVLAGEEKLLKQLDEGNWIGCTIPYFMDIDGGCADQNKVFVNDLSTEITDFKIDQYDETEFERMLEDRYDGGFSYAIIPCFSKIHQSYALQANSLDTLFDIPVVGLIAGVHLSEVSQSTPKVVNGQTGAVLDNHIMVLHCQLPAEKYATIDILNLFEQGEGDTITFTEDGFKFNNCFVNGKETNFAEYILQNNIDTRLPLVADYSGAMINISIQNVDAEEGSVLLYAPVFEGHEYKFAKKVDDYVASFNAEIPGEVSDAMMACNCILNYVYSELDGKKTANLRGPFTFGEIAYVLVNQTMVYLKINNYEV